jgi:hypothetical protein
MVADDAELATTSAQGGRHAIFEVYNQPTPKSANRTDRERFTAQLRDPHRLQRFAAGLG